MDKRIYLNQDDSAFMRGHPIEDMTAEGIHRVVDFYARGEQLAGLAFCVNMQRALFESRVWETLISDHDPLSAENRPGSYVSGEARGMAALKQNGVDQFEVWVTRARSHGVEAFLSMRMNDAHGLEGHGDFWGTHRTKGRDQEHFAWHATHYWKQNPHLRRAPYRYERSFEGAFDYGQEEVRRHHLALIAELFDRYDMDGFEMDWMRWMFMFAPGEEAKGCDILSNFIAEVGALKSAAEKRRGHPILLRHRIPAEPQAALALGYDVPAWAEQGFADHIILSGFGGSANLDYPIPLWRKLVGSNVKILAIAEPGMTAYPGNRVGSYHFSFAAASSALLRGADGIYLFNDCYRESGAEPERRLLSTLLNTLGSNRTLGTVVRRHAVSSAAVRAPGTGRLAVLPVPLTNPAIGADPERWAENITLRIYVGSKPPSARYGLVLGFSEDAPLAVIEALTVRLNTHPLRRGVEPSYDDCMEAAFPGRKLTRRPESVARCLFLEADEAFVQNDCNGVEFEPPPVAGRLEWAEIIVIPLK